MRPDTWGDEVADLISYIVTPKANASLIKAPLEYIVSDGLSWIKRIVADPELDIPPHRALSMRPPVPETLLQSGP